MKLKQIPEDFKVDEIYDLEKLKKKESESKADNYFYFKLYKRDYTVNRAVEQIAKTFNVRIRDIHFAGTKDRQAVTTQLISIKRPRKTLEEDLKYFNNKNPDIKLEFIGKFPARLNLGDNLGNKFEITLRDLTEKDVLKIKEKIKLSKSRGILNLFGPQRFGFQRNNITVGKYLLRGDFEKAFFHILTAIPEDAKEEHKNFVDYLNNNWKKIIESNDWSETLKIIPEWLRQERQMIEWVQKYKNDFLGAINLIHKKIRTMYVNSYQSYIFNETIKYLDSINKLENYPMLPLVASETKLSKDWGDFVQGLLSKDGLNLNYFEMKSSPTIKPKEVMRKVYLDVSELKLICVENDELNLGKQKVVIGFSLESGNYATTVMDWLCE